MTGLAQNMEMLLIEPINNNNSIVIPEKCSPEDLVVVINSSIPDLKFESNVVMDEDFKIDHLKDLHQYIICHPKEKFILTVSGSNFQSEDIKIFDLKVPHVYRISVNIAKGTVNIVTNPNNATIIFPSLNNTSVSSNKPITNVTGKYKIKIEKSDFQTIDTIITIPLGKVNTYHFNLTPLFSPVKLNLKTFDNTKFESPPIIWIDSIRISLDSYVKPGINVKSFYDDGVEFYSLYQDNIIPIHEGNHQVRIECENYTPFETYIYTKTGQMSDLDVTLKLVFGFITFIDEMNGEGAKIFINDQLVDSVPNFKVKVRVGENRVRFEKPGYITDEDEYLVNVNKGEITDFNVSMEVSRKVTFITQPSKAQVFISGERVGFTPYTTLLAAGYHDILLKKSGYSSQKLIKHIDEKSAILNDTVNVKLLINYPLKINSEKKGLGISLIPLDHKDLDLNINAKTPAEILVPYGDYELILKNGKKTTFKGKIAYNENRKQNITIPSYSKTSFTYITADFVNIDNYQASLGRACFLPATGLSTSLINVQYYNFKINNNEYKTLMPYVFLLNWEWRLGGSILRQLDVCVLGSVKWTPGLEILNFHLDDGYYDATMWNYFYGIEISSRISVFNVNIKIGKQLFNGTVNIWDNTKQEYNAGQAVNVDIDNFIISVGITISGRVFKSNNMLRLWRKPLVGKY